jgi:predicted acetyltransferase
VTFSPQVLAQLYIGYRSVGDIIDAGQLVAGKEQANLLSRAFPKYPAFLDDWF